MKTWWFEQKCNDLLTYVMCTYNQNSASLQGPFERWLMSKVLGFFETLSSFILRNVYMCIISFEILDSAVHELLADYLMCISNAPILEWVIYFRCSLAIQGKKVLINCKMWELLCHRICFLGQRNKNGM